MINHSTRIILANFLNNYFDQNKIIHRYSTPSFDLDRPCIFNYDLARILSGRQGPLLWKSIVSDLRNAQSQFVLNVIQVTYTVMSSSKQSFRPKKKKKKITLSKLP